MGRGRKPGERAQALSRGDVTYTGGPCKNCGNMERYACNGGCLECQNKKAAWEVQAREDMGREREVARHRKLIRFIAVEPCKKCRSHERYTSNGSCVVCAKARIASVRDERAQLWHSETSLIVWLHEPPSPETAPYYAMCPALAAYGGEWTAVYSDAQHLAPWGRLYPGCDVFKRPAALQMLLNDKTAPGHEIAQHLAPGYYAALSGFNMKVRGIK